MEIRIRDSSLRRALARLGALTSDEHAEAVQRLPHTGYTHSIVCINGEEQRVTCLMDVFGFGPEGEYAEIARTGIFAGARFARWLLHGRHLRPAEAITERCLLFYFSADAWTHAAVAASDTQAISKWGTFGVFRHPLDEVPAFYGNQVTVYEHPGSDEALRLFKAYAAECRNLPGWAVEG